MKTFFGVANTVGKLVLEVTVRRLSFKLASEKPSEVIVGAPSLAKSNPSTDHNRIPTYTFRWENDHCKALGAAQCICTSSTVVRRDRDRNSSARIRVGRVSCCSATITTMKFE
jgi:hypothetical protein